MTTKSKIRTTIELNPGDKERLQKLAKDLVILQPTGPNAKQAGSVSQLMQDIASGDVILYRAYNELRRPGIYSVTNTVTGRKYIGSSLNIYTRLHGHKRDLAEGRGTRAMQDDYDKFGSDAFVFEAVEFTSDSTTELADREAHYTELAHIASGGCYNRTVAVPRRNTSKRTCKVCGDPHYAMGYCSSHYATNRNGKRIL